MENKENKAIYEKISELYHAAKFKNPKDEKAFRALARMYLGRNSNTGKVDENLRGLNTRKMAGDEYFDQSYHNKELSQEGKTRLAHLSEAYTLHLHEHSKKRQGIRQERKAKTIYGQIENWKNTYHPNITKKLSVLSNAYLGLSSDRRKLKKEDRTVEKRYETADKVLINIGKVTAGEKRAVSDLYNLFKTYDQRDYDKRSTGRDTRTRKLDARRDALRMQHVNTMNHTLEGLVGNAKVETALERTTTNPKQNGGFIQYISDKMRKPWGKVAAVGLGLAAAGLIYGALRGCDRKQPVAPPMFEKKLAEVPKPKIVIPQKEEKIPTAEARTRCIDWKKSKLEQGILEYKFEKDGTFKARVNKYLADIMRKDPNVVLRFIGDNKLYETNKVGPDGVIEIKGATYKTGAQFGIIKKAEGNCGDYLASLRTGKPKEAVAIPEAKKTVTTPKPTIEQKVEEPTKKPIEKKEEYKVAIEEKKPIVEQKVETIKETIIETRKEIEQPRDILTSLKKTTIEYRKAWSPFVGCYDYVRDFKTEEAKSLYEELSKAFKERSPEYLFLNRTPKSVRGAVPKLIAEFSSYEREKRLERMLEEEDMNTLKNVTIVNFEPTRGNNTGYDYLIMLKGTPEEKAAQAAKRITEELTHMREKGHFNTYFWERDVKKNNPSAEAPVQGDIFIKGNGQNKAIGAIFTPEGTEVKLVRDNAESVEERLANDDIRIGKSIPKTLGGNGGDGQGAGAGTGGGVSGGPM